MKVDAELVRKGRAVCPRCGKKGLGYAQHPHAFGYKDHFRLRCRYCQATFKVRDEYSEKPCPYPIPGDDGTAKDCVSKGHCGCGEEEGRS